MYQLQLESCCSKDSEELFTQPLQSNVFSWRLRQREGMRNAEFLGNKIQGLIVESIHGEDRSRRFCRAFWQ